MRTLSFLVLTLIPFTASASFPDVPANHPSRNAVDYVQGTGIVSGYPDGTFRPNAGINRAEFTKIVTGAMASYEGRECSLPFSDTPWTEWYAPFLCFAVEHDIINGYPDGTFGPARPVNAAEAATIVARAFKINLSMSSPWYQSAMEAMEERHALPERLREADASVTRGEMAQMIAALAGGPTVETAQVSSAPSDGSPMIGGCPVLPSNNAWNQDISSLPVHQNSDAYIRSMGLSTTLHADFGGAAYGESYGIPFITVDDSQADMPIEFTAYGDESDPGPYPIPLDAPIEGGADSDGDRHVIAVDTDECMLYELYRAFPTASGWQADSAAKYDLRSNALRPLYWTSADAAGLPILPGLIRYDEVAAGAVSHAIRFTASKTQKAFIEPARHFASSSTDSSLPPMGLRVRLKADFDTSAYTGQALIILETMKKYGMMLADNGSNWYFTGASDPRWNDDELNQLKNVPGSAFEAVETGNLIY